MQHTINNIDRAKVEQLLGSLFTPNHPAKEIAVQWLGYEGDKLKNANESEVAKMLDDLLEGGHIDSGEHEAAMLSSGDMDAQSPTESPVAAHIDSPVVTNKSDESEAPRLQEPASAEITNTEFTKAIFGDLSPDRGIAIAHFPNVSKPNWTARFCSPEGTPDFTDENTYYCPSSLLPGGKRG